MYKILICIFLPFGALAQNSYTAILDSFMQAQVLVKKFNGNVLVAKRGEIIYEKSFGYSNYDENQLLDDNSMFEVASVSKQFTAMAILLLKEGGKLKLSDSLRKFFPALPYQNINIHHLLTHTSGLPDYEAAMNLKWDHKKIAFNTDMIEFLAAEKTPIHFAPGAKWEYSNTAYALLASIVEEVSGKKFSVFMHDNIFSPLGMANTRVYNTRRSFNETIPNYAYGYVYSDSLKKYVLPDSVPQLRFVYYLDGIVGDGTINSTTGDLLKWDRALKSHTLLTEATQRQMLSIQATDSVTKNNYGYGVFVAKNKFGTSLFHSGGWPGYVTFLQRNVEDDITTIVLSNNGSSAPAVANQLLYLVHGEKIIFPYFHKEILIDSSLLVNYAGKYQGPNLMEIVYENGKLYRKGKPNVELKPESASKFFYADGSDRTVEFILNPNGKPGSMWFVANGLKTELKVLD